MQHYFTQKSRNESAVGVQELQHKNHEALTSCMSVLLGLYLCDIVSDYRYHDEDI